MPKTTIADACRQRGISRGDWDEAKRQGIDPWDRKAMDAWISKKRHKLAPGAKITDQVAASAQTLEEMEHAIRSATDIDTVKILKEKVMALKGIVAVQQETRELVPSGEVRESITRAVSVSRGELLKLSSDLPPKLEGLPPAKMQVIIRAAVIDVLARLSDETRDLYAQP
jgi:hypothetical protein